MNKKLVFSLITALILVSSFAVALGNLPTTTGSQVSNPVASPAVSYHTGSVTIYPNGSVSASGVLSQSGNTYTLLQNLNGTLTVERNNSVVNGNGLTINGLGGVGIALQGISGISLTNAKLIDAATAVNVLNVSGISITKLTINTVGAYGIFINYANDVSVSANVFNGTGIPITADYVNNLSITNNFATNVSNDFIYISVANNFVISGNSGTNFATTYNGGLYIEYGTYGQVTGNTVEHADYGLYLYYANYVNSSNNLIENNGARYAIYIFGSNFISSAHDSATNSLGYGLYASNGQGLKIQYDNFNHSIYGSAIDYEPNVLISHSNFSNVTLSLYYGLEVEYSGAINLSYDNFNQTAGAQYPIYLDYLSGTTVLYMDNIYGSTYGIYLYYASNLYVNSTYIDAPSPVYSGSSSVNTVFNSDTFILMSSGTGVSFSGNANSNIVVVNSNFISTSSYSGTGVYIGSTVANNVIVSNNEFVNVHYAINLDPSVGRNYAVNNNFVNNSYLGIEVYEITGLSITGNKVLNAPDYNIEAEYITGANISGNLLSPGNISIVPYAIYMYGSYGPIVISYNTMTGSYSANYFTDGVYLDYVSNATVFDNTINATLYSLNIEDCFNVATFDNTVTNSSYGIYSAYNQVSSFYGNVLVNSSTAVYSEVDFMVSFYGNTFQGAIYDFVQIYSGSEVTFYHNNFLGGNTVNVSASGMVTLSWNMSLPIGGNYWSNYTGTGINGIGTTPYNVTGTYADYLPLTSRWTSPTVTFVETGLPSGTSWQVTLGQATMTSSGSSMAFQLSNGQYMTVAYAIGHVSGYVAAVGSSSLLLNGTSRVVTVSFSPYTYPVTFTETGLASGTSWSVTLNGATRTSSTTAITFNESNGTYTYSIGSVTGYSTSTPAGSVTVSSGSGSVAVKFTENSYTLTLVESGLSSGQTWAVTVNGTPHTVTGNSLTLSLVPGTYTITATGPSGYSVTLQSQNVTIGHSNTTFAVGFQSPGSSSSSLASGTGLEGIGIGAVIGIIAGLIAGLFLMPVLRGKKSKGGQQ